MYRVKHWPKNKLFYHLTHSWFLNINHAVHPYRRTWQQCIWDLYDCKKKKVCRHGTNRVSESPTHCAFCFLDAKPLVWPLQMSEPCPEGNAALLYDALLQGTWQALDLLVLVFLLWFYMCGLWILLMHFAIWVWSLFLDVRTVHYIFISSFCFHNM